MNDHLNLKPEQRLIVAADFRPTKTEGRKGALLDVLALAEQLSGTGVCLKVNSVLRACGYDLIDGIRSRGLGVFADLKLDDIKATLEIDGEFLAQADPELLTVACSPTLPAAMAALKAKLPKTEVLGVTVFTDHEEQDCKDKFGCWIEQAVRRFALQAQQAGLDGLVASGAEAELLKGVLRRPMTINTPNIRPSFAEVKGDDQNKKRAMTPAEAIKAGATRVIIGRPIIRAEKPYDAAMRVIDEIAEAYAS